MKTTAGSQGTRLAFVQQMFEPCKQSFDYLPERGDDH